MSFLDVIDPFGVVLFIMLPYIIWGSVITWREHRDKKRQNNNPSPQSPFPAILAR